MTAETTASPPTVQAATRAWIRARDHAKRCGDSYAAWRDGWNRTATASARNEWGMAILEFISASVALAEAEDRQDPESAAMSGPLGKMFETPSPDREECAHAWRGYQQARLAEDAAAINTARDMWRGAFVRWYEDMAARHAVEDEKRVEEMRDRLEDEMQFDPAEAFQLRGRTKAAELRRADRERQRQASLRRDRIRDQDRLSGWRAAGEEPGDARLS